LAARLPGIESFRDLPGRAGPENDDPDARPPGALKCGRHVFLERTKFNIRTGDLQIAGNETVHDGAGQRRGTRFRERGKERVLRLPRLQKRADSGFEKIEARPRGTGGN